MMCRVMHHNRDLFNLGWRGWWEEMFTIPESGEVVVTVAVCVPVCVRACARCDLFDLIRSQM